MRGHADWLCIVSSLAMLIFAVSFVLSLACDGVMLIVSVSFRVVPFSRVARARL